MTASNHIPREAGPVARRRPPCPVSAPAREGRGSADATGANRSLLIPRWVLVVMLVLHHAFLSGTPRLQFSIPLRGPGPGTACRRRALETVEKVVTGACRSCLQRLRTDTASVGRSGLADPALLDMAPVKADVEEHMCGSPVHVGVGPHDPVPPAADARRQRATHFDDDWLHPGPAKCLALGLGDGHCL